MKRLNNPPVGTNPNPSGDPRWDFISAACIAAKVEPMDVAVAAFAALDAATANDEAGFACAVIELVTRAREVAEARRKMGAPEPELVYSNGVVHLGGVPVARMPQGDES
ncbi:MAG: hypothetical protein EBX35_14565 [Planctomycetia bacterium]|nr:hypothetical protein [Planctomycetia bacterium]